MSNQQPLSGGYQIPNQITRANSYEAIAHSTLLAGGFHQVETIADRDAIPIFTSGGTYDGFSESGALQDGITTGRRSIGMLVKVLEDGKFYTLIPV